MSISCPDCPNENLTDYPACPTHAITRHFEHRNDCRCVACQADRAEINATEMLRLEAVAFIEEIQYEYGRPVAAAA